MKSGFSNPWPHKLHGLGDILRWKLGMLPHEPTRIPAAGDQGAPSIKLDPASIAQAPDQGWRVSWLGHASFLIQGLGKSLLIDPVFSDHCSPLPIPALKRKVAPPCGIADLPEIDAVLLTHSHYDHLDLKTLRQLNPTTPIVIPPGHSDLLKREGFQEIHELGWWDSVQLLEGILITSVPSQHFTARTPFDRNQGHWCGWVIESPHSRLWHAGDSGYCPVFTEIGERFGRIDLAMIPIGCYQPRCIMQAMHMDPDEAVQAFIDARCTQAIGMHWGTFRMTDEPMGEPPLLLEQAVRNRQLPETSFVTGRVGQIWEVG